MPLGRTYSVNESAAFLRVSTKTVRRYLKKGILRCRIVEGKHGAEIRVFQQSLDSVLGQMDKVSKDKEEFQELIKRYQKASPEVRDVVMKILRSAEEPVEKVRKPGSLIASIFKRG